jgi:hypothetical protein
MLDLLLSLFVINKQELVAKDLWEWLHGRRL